jgi:PAS domain-containing protein
MGLRVRTTAVAAYEIIARTFAALPPETTACIRVLTVRAEAGDDGALLATLRGQQERLVDHGVIASQLGVRSLPGGGVEAISVSVWPDLETVARATSGRADRPVFEQELEPWLATIRIAAYDGIEIAPRLPTHAGPPLVILDQELRIVDITATAAAILGLPPPELVGKRLDALATPTDVWDVMLRSGSVSDALEWSIADIGTVLVHVVARRDAPVTGRHAMFVRRRQEPTPTLDDLDAALSVAFPGRTSGTGRRPAG